MADRTALTPIEIAENGNADCAVGTKYSAVADLVAGGAKVAYPKDGKLLIHVKNTAAANKAVTIKAGAGPGKSQGDLAVTVAANTGEQMIGGLESFRFKQSDGTLNIDFAADTTGYIAVFQVP
jgi:hypothetical protein